MAKKSLLHRIFRIINVYSIDVVTGSIMMEVFASAVLKINPPHWVYVILALAVWVFYTADHLLDALKGREGSTIPRHRLHYIHRRIIIPLWIVAAVLTGVLAILKLDTRIIVTGLALGSIIFFYFLALFYNQKKSPWLLQKELIIALAYVAGIWMAPLFWYGTIPPVTIIVIISNMILLAWAEGILVSWFEYHDDLGNEHTSFATMFGKKAAGIFVGILLLTVTGAAFYFLIFKTPHQITTMSFIIQVLMSLLLFMIQLFPNRFRPHHLYRYLGEIVFWLPGLILFI